ncbi:MAG: D-aminoacyl-tRNA deacylase [Spirochaetia bacterium]|jgi:D-tyrosyl-tRNA(Tyr) deacylase
MRAVVQRVSECTVRVGDRLAGSIGSGLLVYLGVGRRDTEGDARALCEKILNLRIFSDEQNKMNRSLLDVRGEILVVSQFTLFGDTREGRRPSYTEAADAETARRLYEHALALFAQSGLHVASGEFQAMMRVSYTNMGPVTILVDSEKKF